MSKVITQVNAAAGADTFQIWVNKTNEVINAISTEAVTVNSHANGGLSTGNGFVEGTFGARNLVANTLRGGTVQTPGVLTISSNVSVIGNTFSVGNVVINSSSISIDGIPTGDAPITANTTGTAAQVIDFWDKFIFRGADYVLTIKDQNANAFQISKLLLVHATGEAYVTEYAAAFSNTSQGEFSANANSTHIKVYLTPVSTNTYVSGTRALVEV
jgi:hypothetical protein